MTAKKPKKLKTFFNLLIGSKRFLFAGLLACFVSVAANYLTPQVLRFLVDNVFGGGDYPSYIAFLPAREYFIANLWIFALVIGAASLVQAAGTYLMRAAALRAGEKTSLTAKNAMFSHIQRLPFSWHASVQTGDIIQRATQDTDIIKRFVAEQVIELIRTVLMIVLGLILMFLMDWRLSMVTVIYMPLIMIFSGVFFNKISSKFKYADEAEGALTAVLQENLTGVRVVRAFGGESRESAKFHARNDEYVSKWMKLGRSLCTYWSLGDLFAGFQVLSVLVAGAFLTFSGAITAGVFITFLFYNTVVVWPVRNMGRILGELSKTGISVGRVAEVLNAEEEGGATGFKPAIRGGIEFRNVSFSYGGARPVLKDVSFSIGPGRTLGIMGGTGGGKSTVAHLMAGLYAPDNGQILLDGTDISEIDKPYLRRSVGIVLQEPFLFSRTVRQNIAIAAPDASDGDISGYAAVACVDAAIEGFERGYDTVVGEKGVTLSGGQKQRVAIARTLISKPPIAILDDSLSAVDTGTDIAIRRALKEKLKGATVILISHRITTLMRADKILVINDGVIAESGTHAELIARGGPYRQIYDLQSSV
jgi:ATP-binding cassette subfamily B protein